MTATIAVDDFVPLVVRYRRRYRQPILTVSQTRRDNMLADPETRNLTPETKYDSHSSKNLTKVRGQPETGTPFKALRA